MEKSQSEIVTEVKIIISELYEKINQAQKLVAELEASLIAAQEQQTPQVIEDISIITEDLNVAVPSVPVEEPAPVVEEESILAPPIVENKVVLDSMIKKQQWRIDRPGGAVKDVRSAISLNDRLLFIRGLFADDAMKFQEVLGLVNSMKNLDEFVAYLEVNFTKWDFESDVVYRFMMAIRRKLG